MTSKFPRPLVFVALAAAACGASESGQPAPGDNPRVSTKTALIAVKKAADWCGEHGVPESVCTRCNQDLVAGFKAKGDWCEKHTLPQSQCVACDPSLEAKLKAMEPK